MTPSTSSTVPGTAPGGSASTAEEVKAQTRDVADTARSEAARVGQEVKSQTSRLVDEVGSKGRERANGQLSRVAGSLGQMSDELDRMARGTSQPDGYLAGFVREGSSAARRLSERLDRDGLDGALDEIKRFARRQPVAFLAGTFAAGMVLGRLTRNADLRSIADAAGSGNGSDGASGDSARGLTSGVSHTGVGSRPPSSTPSSYGETGGVRGTGTGTTGMGTTGMGTTGTGVGGTGVGGTAIPPVAPGSEPAP